MRDEEGMVIAALSQNIKLPSLVDLVKALAARRAILFAQEISITRGGGGGLIESYYSHQ